METTNCYKEELDKTPRKKWAKQQVWVSLERELVRAVDEAQCDDDNFCGLTRSTYLRHIIKSYLISNNLLQNKH